MMNHVEIATIRDLKKEKMYLFEVKSILVLIIIALKPTLERKMLLRLK